MVPDKPGLEETEELGAGASVGETSEPNETAAFIAAGQPSETASEQEARPEASTAEREAPQSHAEVEQDDAAAPAEEPADQDAAEQPRAEEKPATVEEEHGLKRGDLVEGVIVETTPTAVMVDLRGMGIGVVPSHELERMSRQALEQMKVGEPLVVYVVNPHDHNGRIILSINRAIEELDWQKAEEYRQSQQVYETRVAGYNRGGLIVRFGRLRGFVPQSQMSAERRRASTGETPEERWGSMVNEPIVVKVMEVDRSRNRLILSERSAARESREKRKENLIGQLTVGEVREGRVVSLEDFGAFVDIGGAEGLVHLTELSWQHVNHPRDLLHVGQTVRVEVISIDPQAKRIGLSMRRQEPDPWDIVATNYIVGQLVQGTVTKLTKFGAFAQVFDMPEIEGLIHISELSEQRVQHPREVVQEGDKLTLRIVKIDVKNRRLGLSLKRVNSAEYLDLDWSGEDGA